MMGAGALATKSQQVDAGEPQFIDRVNNPENYPYIINPPDKEGRTSTSSHRMAVEIDKDGNWAAFPTIVLMPNGKLKEFDDPFEAFEYNRSIGNTMEFGKDKESALKYGEGGYKTEKLKNYRPEDKSASLYTPEQNKAMAEKLTKAGYSHLLPDQGTIKADEFPKLNAVANFLDKYGQTPIGPAFSGMSEYLRGFGDDATEKEKAKRAFFAAMDFM